MATKNISLDAQLREYEGNLIRQALALTKGDMRAAAKMLDVKERTFWRRAKGHGINAADYRPAQPAKAS